MPKVYLQHTVTVDLDLSVGPRFRNAFTTRGGREGLVLLYKRTNDVPQHSIFVRGFSLADRHEDAFHFVQQPMDSPATQGTSQTTHSRVCGWCFSVRAQFTARFRFVHTYKTHLCQDPLSVSLKGLISVWWV